MIHFRHMHPTSASDTDDDEDVAQVILAGSAAAELSLYYAAIHDKTMGSGHSLRPKAAVERIRANRANDYHRNFDEMPGLNYILADSGSSVPISMNTDNVIPDETGAKVPCGTSVLEGIGGPHDTCEMHHYFADRHTVFLFIE